MIHDKLLANINRYNRKLEDLNMKIHQPFLESPRPGVVQLLIMLVTFQWKKTSYYLV